MTRLATASLILVLILVLVGGTGSPLWSKDATNSSAPPDASGADGRPPAAPQGAPSVPAIQGTLGAPLTFAAHAELQRYGFFFGPSDGQFGAIPTGQGRYVFYGPAGTTAACAGGSKARNGAFTFTGSLDHVTGGNGCKWLFHPGDGPAGWVFDRDYAGGGQVVRFASAGARGWLMPFHSEIHWSDPATADHMCNGVPCFYSSVGLAVSTDAGRTFKIVGQIVQPSQPLSVFMGGGTNMSVGDGSLVVADANGQHLDNPPSSPASAYFYLFYGDRLPGLPGACARASCIGVARARYTDVVAAALSGDPQRVSTVFHKYDGSAPDPWTQPATSATPNESGTAGSYAPVWSDEGGGVPSVIYDRTFDVYLAAYLSGGGVKIRASRDLLHWSGPIAAYAEPGRRLFYPTMIGETGDPTIGGPVPRLYFSSFLAFPNWATSVFESVPLTLSSR